MLHESLLNKFSQMCSQSQHPNVTHIEKLSCSLSLKLIRYNKGLYKILYNKTYKTVTPIEDLFCGPLPNKKNREKYRHKKHTKQRLMERFAIEASDKDLTEMAALCHTKYHHIKISSQPDGRTKNLIHFKGTDMLAVYEPSSDSIVTAMPTEYLHKEERDWLYCSKRVRYKQFIKHTKEPL